MTFFARPCAESASGTNSKTIRALRMVLVFFSRAVLSDACVYAEYKVARPEGRPRGYALLSERAISPSPANSSPSITSVLNRVVWRK